VASFALGKINGGDCGLKRQNCCQSLQGSSRATPTSGARWRWQAVQLAKDREALQLTPTSLSSHHSSMVSSCRKGRPLAGT
jgi:hypothetical protein